MTSTAPAPAPAPRVEGADLRLDLPVAAPTADVLAAVTTAEGVSGWWFPTTAAGRDADGSALLHVAMGDSGVDLRVRVDEQPDGGAAVAWDVLDCPVEPAWVGTTIRFALRPSRSGGTDLRFAHDGLAALPCLEVCTAGWSWYLPSLAAHASNGTGAPGPRPR